MPARQLMSIQCWLSPPLACSLSLNSSQPSRHKQTILHVCMYLCTRVTLRRAALFFFCFPSLLALLRWFSTQKKLIASFDNQLHLARGCLDALHASFRLLLQSRNGRKLAERNFTEGTRLKWPSRPCVFTCSSSTVAQLLGITQF